MHQQCPRFEWLRGLKSSGGAPLRVVHIAVAPSQRRSWSKRSGTLGSKLQIKNQVLQIKLYLYKDIKMVETIASRKSEPLSYKHCISGWQSKSGPAEDAAIER